MCALSATRNGHEQETYTQLMLDSTPMICSVWEEGGRLIDCNMEAVRVLGIDYKSDYIQQASSFWPKYQPDGSLSVQVHAKRLARAFDTGFQQFTWEFLTAHGNRLPASVTMLRVSWRKSHRVLSYAIDLRETEWADAQLRRQAEMLQAINIIGRNLMEASPDEFADCMPEQLGILGSAVGTNRVYLWENRELNGKLYARKVYEWPRLSRRPPDALYTNFMDYGGVPYFWETLSSGKSLNTLTDQLPDRERTVMKSNLVQASLNIPIFYGDAFWGFIGFENTTSPRVFTDLDEKILRSCGFLIVSVIMRARAMERLVASQQELFSQRELLQAVNNMGTLLLANRGDDFGEVVHSCLQVLGECMAADRTAFWRIFDQEGTQCMQRPFEWTREANENPGESNARLVLADYFPQWSERYQFPQDISHPMYRMNAKVRALPDMQGVGFVLLIPIMLDGVFWAFLAFAFAGEVHSFSKEVRDILRTASLNLALAIDNQDIKSSLATTERRASLDALTGIENRRRFLSHAAKVFEWHKAHQSDVCVGFFDIDHFKRVNDSYGHAFGDEVLSAFAKQLKNTIRPGDLIGRYGGEEFVLLLPGADKESGLKVCRRILQQTADIRFERHPEFSFTVSIGLTSCVPQKETSLEQCIEKADRALYQAKEGGRNAVVFL